MIAPKFMQSVLMNSALVKAMTHDSAPAGATTPRPPTGTAYPPSSSPRPPSGNAVGAGRTQAQIAQSKSDLSLFTPAARGSSSYGLQSSFTPAANSNVAVQSADVKAQWEAMGKSTPALQKEAQQIGNQLVVAILRGDSGAIFKLAGQLQNIGNILKGRSVPNSPTDMLAANRYQGSIKKMSNPQLNDEWNLQAARAMIASFRGDKSGVADAQKKLAACQSEVKGRVDNILGDFMKQLTGMSDEDLVAANAEATADVASQGADEASAADETDGADAADSAESTDDAGGDDIGEAFGKMIASGMEMVGRSIEESLTAPFKALASIFNF